MRNKRHVIVKPIIDVDPARLTLSACLEPIMMDSLRLAIEYNERLKVTKLMMLTPKVKHGILRQILYRRIWRSRNVQS